MRSSVQIDGATAKIAEAGKQAPFALALALTSLARDAQGVVERTMPARFDRPTPFTQRGVAILPATRDVPVAQVFIKDAQAKYLVFEEEGGVRMSETGAPVVLPVQISTNAYGNIGKGVLRREKAKSTTFVAHAGDPATAHLPPGVYRRVGRRGRGGLKLLAAFERKAVYQPVFGFVDTVVATVRRLAPRRLREAMDRALATARR